MKKTNNSIKLETQGKEVNNGGSIPLLISGLVFPIIFIFIELYLEYWSGWFVPNSNTKNIPTLNQILVYYLALLFFVHLLLKWFSSITRQQKFTREEYAFRSLLLLVSGAIIILLGIISNIVPWSIFSLLPKIIENKLSTFSPPAFVNQILIIVLFIFPISKMFQIFQNWHGKKSTEHFKREQQGENWSLFQEGQDAYKHLLSQNLYTIHKEEIYEYVSQMVSITESQSWIDQAKELIRLAQPEYYFPQDGWHAKANCWVGENIHTKDLVFVYPISRNLNEDSLQRFSDYTIKASKSMNQRISDRVIAIRGDTLPDYYDRHAEFEWKTESDLLDNLVNFTDYEIDIRKRVEKEKLPDSEFTIQNAYVPSLYFDQSNSITSETVEVFLDRWLVESGRRQIALLGEYGQGKSTTALMLTYRLLFQEKPLRKRIPILIELRGTSPRNLNPLSLLGAWASRYRIDPQALMRLLMDGRLLIIFEGFDEMALIGNLQMRLAHFKTLWEFAYEKSKIIITGRPNFFLDEQEMKSALGIDSPQIGRAYCEALRLAPFDLNQIEEALGNMNIPAKAQILEMAKGNKNFYELISRPASLYMVSVLWEREHLGNCVEDLNSAFIMELFIRNSFRRQGLKEDGEKGFMALSNSERKYFMYGIAAYMVTNNLPNQINGNTLNQLITELIDVIPDEVSLSSTQLSGDVATPLRIRIKDDEHGVEHIQTDVRTCGLLVDDFTSSNSFRFGHKSIMEFLFASILAFKISPNFKEYSWLNAINHVVLLQIGDILKIPDAISYLGELTTSEINTNNKKFDKKSLEKNFVKRLFNLLYPNTFYRIILSSYARLYSIQKNKSQVPFTKRLIYIFATNPSILVMLYFLIIFSLKDTRLLTFLRYSNNFTFSLLLFLLLFVYVNIMISILPFFSIALSRRLRRKSGYVSHRVGRFYLWNYLCFKVGISNEVMHKFSGTWIFSEFRKQPFDYFISKKEKNPKD